EPAPTVVLERRQLLEPEGVAVERDRSVEVGDGQHNPQLADGSHTGSNGLRAVALPGASAANSSYAAHDRIADAAAQARPLRSRRNCPYAPALPTVTSTSPRSIVSEGCAPVIGSGRRRIAVTVMPALALKPASASVRPIQGLSSGTEIHSIWRDRK